jgi:hypothetical protein
MVSQTNLNNTASNTAWNKLSNPNIKW